MHAIMQYNLNFGSLSRMLYITYPYALGLITGIWIAVRIAWAISNKRFRIKREIQLLFVYICIIVVVRFTFFPFEKIDGKLQPLVFDAANCFPFRINYIPFIHLMDYPERRSTILNLLGNTAMFLPLGIVWPSVFKKLNTHGKVIAAGVGCSLVIEILQLPFFDRVTDIDDLILNTTGFLLGYGIYLLITVIGRTFKRLKAK